MRRSNTGRHGGLTSPIALSARCRFGSSQTCQVKQDQGLEKTLDVRVLLDLCKPALESGASVRADLPLNNVNRAVGVRLGSEVTRRYGAAGLPADTIRLSSKDQPVRVSEHLFPADQLDFGRRRQRIMSAKACRAEKSSPIHPQVPPLRRR